MSGYLTVPELSVQQVHQRYSENLPFIILDVREAFELRRANLSKDNLVHIPMSKLAAEGQNLFPEEIRDKSQAIIIMCHHGIRSYQVARWMIDLGWQEVYSMRGGIEDWARKIDKSVGYY